MKKNLKTQLVKLALLYIISAVCITIMLCACSTHRKSITRKVDACPVKWADNIKNSDNSEFVDEVAFNLGISSSAVTQEQFNERYVLTTKTN